MVRVLLKSVAALGLLYLAYATVLFAQQRDLLYPGAARLTPSQSVRVEGAAAIEIPSTFGHVRALLLHSTARDAGPVQRAPAVVFMHGNLQSIEAVVPAFDRVRARGLHVLLVEYPGYAGAPGSPSFDTLREAGIVAFDWLVRQPLVDPARIVAMGGSIGGGPAAQLTADRPVRALVLLSTFGEIGQFARERWLPGAIMLDPFDNLARVSEFRGPVMVFHGERDDVIPFASAVQLAAAARDATLVPLACGHEDCPYDGEPFASALAEFLSRRGVLELTAAHDALAQLEGGAGLEGVQ